MKSIRGLLAIAILFCSGSAFAQAGSPVKIDLGIKVGANFTSLKGDGWDNGLKTGFLGGVYGGVGTKKVMGMIEVLFSQTKFTTTGKEFFEAGVNASGVNPYYKNQADSNKIGTIGVSTLQVPILFTAKIAGPMWIVAGPQYTGIIGLNDEDDIFTDVKNVIKTGDVGGVIGVNLKISKLNIGGRYVFGFSDLSASSFTESWRQKMIQLSIGYSFL